MSQSNFDILLSRFKEIFPDQQKDKVDKIGEYVKNYINDNGFVVKYLNSCSTGFAGVRTRDQIIICAPNNILHFGDFIYTIFHEIRHEEQMSKLKISNPLTDFDLDDFETLYEKYWELELDADSFAKKKIASLIIDLKIPIEIAKKEFRLSEYISSYPNMGHMIKHHLKSLIRDIKDMKNRGIEYEDIQDHPIVKRHIDKLESFL
jgi:hypothetical protein